MFYTPGLSSFHCLWRISRFRPWSGRALRARQPSTPNRYPRTLSWFRARVRSRLSPGPLCGTDPGELLTLPVPTQPSTGVLRPQMPHRPAGSPQDLLFLPGLGLRAPREPAPSPPKGPRPAVPGLQLSPQLSARLTPERSYLTPPMPLRPFAASGWPVQCPVAPEPKPDGRLTLRLVSLYRPTVCPLLQDRPHQQPPIPGQTLAFSGQPLQERDGRLRLLRARGPPRTTPPFGPQAATTIRDALHSHVLPRTTISARLLGAAFTARSQRFNAARPRADLTGKGGSGKFPGRVSGCGETAAGR